MPKNGTWTNGELEHLYFSRNLSQPKSFAIIARELNRTYDSVKCKFRDCNWELYNFAHVPLEITVPRELDNWSNEEMEILFKARTGTVTKPYDLIAAEIGRTAETCKAKYCKTDWQVLGYDATNANETRYVYKSELAQKEINALDKRHNAFSVRADLLGDILERSVEKLPKAPKPVYSPSKLTKELGTPEDVGLILSDIHVGHQHTLEDTGGISEYNHEILLRRIENLKYATQDIYELHSKLYKLPTLHIFCLGDIVAGMNDTGAWSPLYIASPIVDQMVMGFDAISSMIYYWLGMFDNIVFYGIGGNHGRTAKQGIQKDRDNWDYVCYKFLEVAFRDNPRGRFELPKSWWLMPKVRNHNFLLVHGDYTRGGVLPLKALQTFEGKMSAMRKVNIDYTLAGHYHNSAELTTNSGKIILNGSFVGSDVYSIRNVHAASVPEQKLFGIHDQHGITWTYNINLDSHRPLPLKWRGLKEPAKL